MRPIDSATDRSIDPQLAHIYDPCKVTPKSLSYAGVDKQVPGITDRMTREAEAAYEVSQATWDGYGERYDRMFESAEIDHTWKVGLRHIPRTTAEGVAVDWAAGTFRTTRAVADQQPNRSLVAVERSLVMIEKGRQHRLVRWSRRDLGGLAIVRGDISRRETLKEARGIVDFQSLVFALQFLGWGEQRRFADISARLARPGSGELCMVTFTGEHVTEDGQPKDLGVVSRAMVTRELTYHPKGPQAMAVNRPFHQQLDELRKSGVIYTPTTSEVQRLFHQAGWKDVDVVVPLTDRDVGQFGAIFICRM